MLIIIEFTSHDPFLRPTIKRPTMHTANLWISSLMDNRDIYKQTFHVNSSLPGLVGGRGRGAGGAQVRGADPKGVTVTAVGLDIRLLCYVMFPGWVWG